MINYVYDLETTEMKQNEIEQFENYHKDIINSLDKENTDLHKYKSQRSRRFIQKA